MAESELELLLEDSFVFPLYLVEVDALKLAPNNWGMRHRRDSISGLSIHSQPLGPLGGSFNAGGGIYGGGGGTQSPAPTYHSQGKN